MNYLDIVLALLLITGMIRGFIKGFIFEVAVLGALFLGLYAAFKFSAFAEPYVCLLYTSDAADERSSVDLGGRRII